LISGAREEVQVMAVNAGKQRTGRYTIDDVARLAGVSRQTVSNVLRGRGGFASATAARVLSAATTLDYRPHRGASSLRSKRTMQLGYHMPNSHLRPGSVAVLLFMHALVRAAARVGYDVLVFASDGAVLDEMSDLVDSGTVDAFVLSELDLHDVRVKLLAERGVPFACFGRTASDLPQSWVDIDNVAGVAAAVDHLVRRGIDRLAFIGYGDSAYWHGERLQGFQQAVGRHRVRVPKRWIVSVDDDANLPAIARKLLTGERRPTGVVTSNDALAAPIYPVAASLGLEIGKDLAVTGFGGSEVLRLLDPALTTVVLPVEDIAARVVDRALREISGASSGEPGQIVVPRLALGASA
jgi:DNA-binding LacI/PurR family transcriptional regulator